MKTIRVGVIMGGRGSEKEVSFNSGRTVCDHLDTYRYTIVPLFQRADGKLFILPERFLHRGKISDFEHRLDAEAEKIAWSKLKERVDFIYIAMHGRLAEDGTLQGFLEVLGIPYFGSKVFASALGMDKIFQKKILKHGGIRVPNGITIYPELFERYKQHPEELRTLLLSHNLTFPLFAKPHKEGSSLGAGIVFNDEQLLPALEKAITTYTILQAALLEEYITGMEFTCIVITDYATGELMPLPPTEVIPEENSHFLDYEQKYMPGRATKFTPARCSPDALRQIREECIKVMRLLDGKNIARIDGFLTDRGIYVTDPNTFCGMAPSSYVFRQAAELNMSHTAFINHVIETDLVQYGLLSIEDSSAASANYPLRAIEKNSYINRSPTPSPGGYGGAGRVIAHREADTQGNVMEQKKRIGVLLGGRSHEKEISLESGRNVFYKLSPQKYEPIALFLDDKLELYRINQALLVRNSTKEIVHGLTPDMKVAWEELPAMVDFIFIGLHGGEGENGCIQGTLEMLGMPYNGSSVLTSALCMDKYKTTEFLKSQGFHVPQHYLVAYDDWKHNQQQEIDTIYKKLDTAAALIVKPHDDGCSVLVHKIRSREQLIAAIEQIFSDGKSHAFVEEFITGMELTVGVVGNHTAKALPPSQTVTTGDILSIEEKFLPGAGENQTPAPLPAPTIAFVQKTIADVYTALNCKGYSRIDCFYQTSQQSSTGSERLVILEVNTLPGLTPATCIFHQAAEIGLKPMEFIDLIVELGFEEHGKNASFKKETDRAIDASNYKPVYVTEESM